MPRKIPTYIVDSFTNEAFKGNPAGVCLLESPLNEWEMQSIAAELNLSETAFVQKTDDPFRRIRYFSPKMEIPLCGPATLASAKVLVEQGESEIINLITGEGLVLKVVPEADGLLMEFPRYKTSPAPIPEGMQEALGIEEVLNSVYNTETNILLLEIRDAHKLKSLSPGFNALVKTHDSLHGVLVTARGEDGYDFHSRYFWPWSGSNEDPVTGATHTFLAPYWGERLGKQKMRSFQASERTGFMELELTDERLWIKGRAVLVLEGIMRI